MPTLLEMASQIVASHASTSALSKEELLNELQEVYNALSAIEKGETVAGEPAAAEDEQGPAVSKRKAFGKGSIACMICGKGGMKTLTRHLKTAHDMTARDYRKQFNIPAGTPLAAKDYSESRRQMAIERGLGEKLAAGRAAKAEKAKRKKSAAKKPSSKQVAQEAGE